MLVITGPWVVSALSVVDEPLRAFLEADPDRRIDVLDLTGLERLDTAGAWLIHRARRRLSVGRPLLTLRGAEPSAESLLSAVAEADREAPKEKRSIPLGLEVLARTGSGVVSAWEALVTMIGFSGIIIQASARVARRPSRLRVTSIVHHIEQAGFNAVPIITLINFLIGAVIAFMSADILRDYGGEIFTVDLISFSFLREFGVLLAAVMVAGRSGSAFTAEIGAMKGHEEVDAMRALALDPVELLVLPRVIALVVSLPILTFLADLAGLLGGGLVIWWALGMQPEALMSRFTEVTVIDHFWVGMIKAPFFAYLIALIGCYQGFAVTGSAESVGQKTTTSVVQSIFTVIVVDALFAMFFLEIEY